MLEGPTVRQNSDVANEGRNRLMSPLHLLCPGRERVEKKGQGQTSKERVLSRS